jgi:predicted nuclease of predicted toxin-antitoxin system
MKSKFLLDAHISPVVAEILAKDGFDVRAVAASPLSGAEDDELLQLAANDKRLFITYDNATVPATAAELLQQGMEVPAIIYVSMATIPSNDFSGLAKALKRLAAKIESGEVDPSGGLFLGGA